MSSAASQKGIAQAIAAAAKTGELPEDQDVVSAQLFPDVIPAVQKEIAKARKEIEGEVKRISRGVAPDVDTWIEQARQLQTDIEQSKAVAKDIVRQAEEAKQAKYRELDATQKKDLLRTEVNFNEKLTDVLSQIQIASKALSKAQTISRDGDSASALQGLEQVDASLAALSALKSTNPIRLLAGRAEILRTELVEQSNTQWRHTFSITQQEHRLALPKRSSLEAAKTIELNRKLGLLQNNVIQLATGIKDSLMVPRLGTHTASSQQRIPSLVVDDSGIQLTRTPTSTNAQKTLQELTKVTTALNERFPPEILPPLTETIMPDIVERLVNNWLTPELPIAVQAVEGLQDLLTATNGFADHLADIGWPGGADLTDWSEQVPRNWLSKQRESALASVRTLLSKQINSTRKVERVETQMVAQDDIMTGVDTQEDDWNADWEAEDSEDRVQSADSTQPAGDDEDDAAAAWGWDDDANGNPASPQKAATTGDEEEDTAAWDDWDEKSAPPSPERKRPSNPQTNGNKAKAHKGPKEVTLREEYTITAVPDDILELISQLGRDAESLAIPPFSDSPIAPAAVGLYSIPTLALAGFRAFAPSQYQNIIGGNMFLYNDSMRLADVLNTNLREEPSWLSPKMKLDAEVKTLESFSRRAYGREMESQRTILRDLLDGAQGFTNCTEQPFAAQCENAVSATVDRVKDIAKEWAKILSRSALLQSLGSLLSTVVSKMIADIEDLTDIGDEESKTLRKFCNEIAKLNVLFLQEDGHGGSSDMTGVYTPNWFKLQYLGEIMESSLADIKYLWTEGELRLEFEADELIDLVQALFADSDHRRRAIADIRRG